MPTPEIERALAEGAARSRAALTARPDGRTAAGRAALYRAHGRALAVRLRDLWDRRRWWLIGAAILALLEIVAGLGAAASAGHF